MKRTCKYKSRKDICQRVNFTSGEYICACLAYLVGERLKARTNDVLATKLGGLEPSEDVLQSCSN